MSAIPRSTMTFSFGRFGNLSAFYGKRQCDVQDGALAVPHPELKLKFIKNDEV